MTHRAKAFCSCDRDFIKLILSQADMNAVFCALADIIRNLESKQPSQYSECNTAINTFKAFILSHPIVVVSLI